MPSFAFEPLESRRLFSATAVPGQFILRLDDVHGKPAQQLQHANERLAGKAGFKASRFLGEDGLVLLQAPKTKKLADVNAALRGVRGFRHVEPDLLVSIDKTPADPSYGQLWGMNNTGQDGGTADADIDAPEAWEMSTGSAALVTAVLDTGVDYTHPDLVANIWTNRGETPGDGIDNDNNGYVDDVHGWDFYNNDADPMDDHSHGTHCAGTIAASGDNGDGVAGVNWAGKIMALKFIGAQGYGETSGAIAAMNYVRMMKTQHNVNVRVTSNSWGGDGYSQELYDAIAAAGSNGILFVAAAGNGGDDHVGDDNDVTPNYPSNYDLDNVIAVAATDHNDRRAGFSNFGATSVDLAAPGVSVLSTVPNNGYANYSGTSMATPHVAGVASLSFSYSPGATIAEVKAAILGGVDHIADMQGASVSGGRLNALNTLNRLPKPGDIDGNGLVNLGDFNILASHFGQTSGATRAQGDLTGDGRVNLDDFNILASNFGNGTGS